MTTQNQDQAKTETEKNEAIVQHVTQLLVDDEKLVAHCRRLTLAAHPEIDMDQFEDDEDMEAAYYEAYNQYMLTIINQVVMRLSRPAKSN